MDKKDAEKVAAAIAKSQAVAYQDRKNIYISALSNMGFPSNCCEEGLCGADSYDRHNLNGRHLNRR